MATNTIDYIISIVIVTTVLTSSIVIVSQDLGRAVTYQQDQQTYVEASNLLNNLLQNKGYPLGWGQTNETPTSFGLNDPFAEMMMPSPFTPMRLMQTKETIIYNSVEYRNLTTPTTNLFLRSDEYIDYAQAVKLLSVDETFDFQLSIIPVLRITVSQKNSNPLIIGVSLEGSSGTLSGASLKASLFQIKNESKPYPSISNPIQYNTVSNVSGDAEIAFPNLNDTTPYIVLVKADAGVISGVGYYSNAKDSPILPIVTSYKDGEVSLVHSTNIVGDVYYNLTFITQVGKTDFQSVELGTMHGIVNTSTPGVVRLGPGNPGILLVSSKIVGDNNSKLTIMPWGITPLCLSLNYGADSADKKNIAQKSQLVSIYGLSYQVDLTLWRKIEN